MPTRTKQDADEIIPINANEKVKIAAHKGSANQPQRCVVSRRQTAGGGWGVLDTLQDTEKTYSALDTQAEIKILAQVKTDEGGWGDSAALRITTDDLVTSIDVEDSTEIPGDQDFNDQKIVVTRIPGSAA